MTDAPNTQPPKHTGGKFRKGVSATPGQEEGHPGGSACAQSVNAATGWSGSRLPKLMCVPCVFARMWRTHDISKYRHAGPKPA
jgi:hypothetical protein